MMVTVAVLIMVVGGALDGGNVDCVISLIEFWSPSFSIILQFIVFSIVFQCNILLVGQQTTEVVLRFSFRCTKIK